MGQSNALITWDTHGVPSSSIFDDHYFCQENGYAEAVYVGCGGNALRERFAALPVDKPGIFTIIETGFGTGLDFCCAWQVWEACAPASWSLHFVSLERYPLLADQIGRALGLWPSLVVYKEQLVAQYRAVPGDVVHLFFDQGRVHLSVVFDDVLSALERIYRERIVENGADAWFLDGFGPAKNPDMWSAQVFERMARLSKPGTTLSTFTVAGVVRRGLEAQGFVVTKIPGHGKKNQMLTGYLKSF